MGDTMNKKEENLKKAFTYIHTFYNEAAQMMTDVIELMDKDGWEAQKDYVTEDLSYSLDYPEKWMCYYLYKNFITKKIGSYYKGMMIFLDESRSNFPPSIVCGTINVPPDSYHKFHLFYLWFDNKNKLKDLSGEEINVSYEDSKQEITGKLFAIPLTEIESKNVLDEKVIKRLLEM
jgi:hypothetical protein